MVQNHRSPWTRPIATAGHLLLLALAAACTVEGGEQPTFWPPEDFHLDVRGLLSEGQTARQTHRVAIWADGLVVYRESSGNLPDCPIPIPVFDTVSAYRLAPESVRGLSRELRDRKLYEFDEQLSDNRRLDGEQIVVAWQAFGRSGQVSSLTATGTLDGIVHAINAYLPEGRELRYANLAGAPDDRRVSSVPEPERSRQGALRYHQELLANRPEQEELHLHLFALALLAGEREVAEGQIERIAAMDPGPLLGELLPGSDWQEDFVQPLRRYLEDRLN